MLKIFPKYLNFENISKKCIRVPWPYSIFLVLGVLKISHKRNTVCKYKLHMEETNHEIKANILICL